MSQEIDYPTKLKQYLREKLKWVQSTEMFEQLIEDSYFSEKVLDYELLQKIINDSDAERFMLGECVFEANHVFLYKFMWKARSRLEAILKKVDEITNDHRDPHYCRNWMLMNLLLTLYAEKVLKRENWLMNIVNKVDSANRKVIEKDLGSLFSSLDNLRKLFGNTEVWSESSYPPEYYQKRIIEPIRDKAVKCGLSSKKLDELATFMEEHKDKQLSQPRVPESQIRDAK